MVEVGHFDIAIGFKRAADLIPTCIRAAKFEFLPDLVGEADGVKALEQLAAFVEDGLRFGREGHARHVLYHEIAFKPSLHPDLSLGEGNEMVGQRSVAIIPVQSVSPCVEVAAVEKHPDEAIGFEGIRKWL